MTKLDKRDRSDLFRRRLGQALTERGMSQSALAREVGIDRSTVSQILSGGDTRLPNAQVVAECASTLGVSGDWLLGLTDLPERAADLLAASILMTEAPRALVDEQIFTWHQEAAGYKIRHVPAAFPDMLKTHDVLRWEYAPHLGRTIDQAIGASDDRLTWMRSTRSDYEIAMPLFEVASLIAGTGYYDGLSKPMRKAQVDHLIELHAQLYPSLRVYLFDARRLLSAPVTVFGPLIGVIYLGQHYLAFRDTERVTALIRHFDLLVREAHVSSREFPEHLRKLADQAF